MFKANKVKWDCKLINHNSIHEQLGPKCICSLKITSVYILIVVCWLQWIPAHLGRVPMVQCTASPRSPQTKAGSASIPAGKSS